MSALTPFGYITDPKDYGDLEKRVKVATDAKNGACFALGDDYNYGQTHYPDICDQAFDDAKVRLVTIQNYARVCRSIPRQRRIYDLSFRHYDVVKAMDESAQDELLSKAVKNGWTSSDLRDAKNEYENKPKPTTIKTTCKVIDLVKTLTEDFGLGDNDVIDITAKLADLQTGTQERAA